MVFQGSGHWSGAEPHCEAFSNAAIAIFTIAALVFLTITILCVLCCLYARKIKVVLFMKFRLSFGQRLEMYGKRYDVFVIYDHDDDGLFIENELITLLEENKLKVANTKCTTLGKDQFSGLETMLKLSRTALIVLTENFLKLQWNLYDLNQAVITEFQQKNFKVVFLMCQKCKNLTKMPDNLNMFLRLGTTINKFEWNWQDLLVYEVTHKTRRPLSKRLSFGKRVPNPKISRTTYSQTSGVLIEILSDNSNIPAIQRRHSM